MTSKSRLHGISAGALILAMIAPGGLLAQNRQDQIHPDAAGPAAQSLAAHRPAVQFTNGGITAGHPLASTTGLRILLAGGNAADASVATLATLHVVRPQSSGTGGNGFFTIYDKATDQVYSLGATGAAALAVDPRTMTREALDKGIRAGVVPGLFGGWIALLDRFGTMSLAEVLGPAIDYAQNGHPIEESVAGSIARSRSLFEQFPTSARLFLPEGEAPEPGEMFRMSSLANTFQKVVQAEQQALAEGKSRSQALQAAFDRFYKGDIAQEMARFYEENGGDFTLDDFAAYEPIWAEPVHTTFRGYDIYSSPSTSRGGFEVAMQLNLVEGFDLKEMGHNSAETLHVLAEAIKVAKSDIYHYVADPEFIDVPMAGLLSKEYAVERRGLISEWAAMQYPEAGEPPGSPAGASTTGTPDGPQFDEGAEVGGTTSFSVADQFGNVIAATPTHGGGFGTGVVVGSTGLLFNNGTRIGSTSPYPDDVNYVRGGQIPLLNNSPVIVMKDGEFVLAIGSPGGETIGQTQFQTLLNVLEFGMSIQEAVAAPRFALTAEPNFYLPGAELVLNLESRIGPTTVAVLRHLGHQVEVAAPYSLGSNQGIFRDLTTGTFWAGADPRRVAYAVGW
ncbi:MAG: gamma-glutamyltransferase family protein [Longimicrobiales bacterium]